ncbi:MAG: ribonuclease HII, partial [Pseudomonadota bacterium]
MMTAGVDEVGRGPLVGNVVAAAVILPEEHSIEGLRDSKKLSEKKRNVLYQEIVTHAIAFSIAHATPQEIDEINILQASLLAMKRAVEGLSVLPQHVLVDGNKLPKWVYSSEAVVGGDDLHDCIAAASILAKVTRDQEMSELDAVLP